MKSLHLPNIKLVIFDFDGTIADTSEGILDSHRFTLRALNRDVPPDEELKCLIGKNLLRAYIEYFGFEEKVAREAVGIYRKRYAEVGIHKATLYPSFADMLMCLRNGGVKIGVATLKVEAFAKIMLHEMKIEHCFDYICGMDKEDRLDKAGLILKCVNFSGLDRESTVLVGDSNDDRMGAIKAGVKFIGVTYGFGFKKTDTYEFIKIDNPLNLLSILEMMVE